MLAGKISVLVGQSGVGKSSLVNALLPAALTQIETGGLMREEEGRHTTTASRSYPLDSGGTLIDSRECAISRRRSSNSTRKPWDSPRWIASRLSAVFRIANTCRNRPAR
jgi:predicted GTPase